MIAPPPTLTDKLRALGGVPPSRVIWLGRPATERDLLRMAEGEPKRLAELVDGFLVEKPMGQEESFLAAWIGNCLNNFVVPRRLGPVGVPYRPVRTVRGRVRFPDVSFTLGPASRRVKPTVGPSAEPRPRSWSR